MHPIDLLVKRTLRMPTPAILSTHIHPTSYAEAVARVLAWAREGESRSVYAANVHMVMTAYDCPEFRDVVNAADLVTPDGMPLVWVLRRKGFPTQERVYGPTLMLNILEAAAREQIPVGFLGGTPELLSQLTARMTAQYAGLMVAAQAAPPFRALSDAEDAALIEQLNQSGVRILFVGLGCPKQEIWIAEHRGKVNAVMAGVGAAFAFHAGAVRQAPAWMQKLGLEWLFRLWQEPRRLWKRYFFTNPRFVCLMLREWLFRCKGEGC